MELYAQLQEQIQMQQQQIAEQMAAEGYDPADAPAPAQEIKIEEVTFAQLIEAGQIEVVRTSVKRIKQCVIMGDTKLYERILPIEKYPIVPFVNTHTRTPYPVSDVRMVKGIQEYINKTRSLIVAHATTSTNTKILVPEGSVDMREFEQKWAQPGVAIPYDPTDGAPMPVQPSPLPNELYNNETTAKNDIDHQLGLYEMMMGNSSVAPQTYKATISIDEFGQRKMKSKLADIESSLVRVGEIAIPLMQQLYKTEKTFRIVQPNNSLDEYVINKRLVDDKSNEIKTFNDITIGKYDVIVVTGSTLPSNRYAELEFYMEAYKNGLIDRVEVLKKTEIFDKEGVMQRFDYITQLEQQLEQAAEQIKDLEGDLQTRDRENVNLKQKVEVEKFKSGLDKVSNKASAAGTLYEKRLDDSLASVRKDIADAKKPDSPR
jgi:regulator of replication initiation timing